MAFETASTSSPSAQSTSSGGGDNNDNNSGTFSPGSSPPLILAFLAIGLFSAAMIAVFGWRRVNFGRHGTFTAPGFTMEDGRGTRSSRRRGLEVLGDRPRLWDLWSDKGQGGEIGGCEVPREVRWENVMPIAVSPLYEARTPQSTTKPITNARASSSALTIHQHIARSVRSLLIRNERSIMDAEDEKHDTPPPPSMTSLQIAVAIAMPTPRKGKRKSMLSEQSMDGDDDERLEYVIGLSRLPWNGEEG